MIIYYLIKSWVWLSLRLFFNEVNVSGKENIPKDKGIIFYANHFNTLLDPLLIVTAFFKKTWFLTRSDVFKKERIIKLLKFFGSIPTYRVTDGFKAPLQNEKTFSFCREILSNNGWIALFPEGTHGQKRSLKPFKKGIMRIWEQNPEAKCVAVALNFSSLSSPNSRISIDFGKPIDKSDAITKEDLRATLEEKIIINPGGANIDAVLDLDWGKAHRIGLSKGKKPVSENWQELADFLGPQPKLILPFSFFGYIKAMLNFAAFLPLTIAGLFLEIPFRILLVPVLRIFKDHQFHLAIHWLLKHFYVSFFIILWVVFLITKGLISFYTLGLFFMLAGLLIIPLAKRQLNKIKAQYLFVMLSEERKNSFLKIYQNTVNQ